MVFDVQTDPQARRIAVEGAGGQVVQELRLIPAVAATFAQQQVHQAIVRLIGQGHGVVRVDEDLIFEAVGAAEPHAQQTPWGVDRVQAPLAWSRSRGAGAKVAILDTGVDPGHPDLRASIAGGFNAIVSTASWADDHGHGTHVAGVVAALDNQEGVVGVAPSSQIYAVKVLGRRGRGYWSDIAKGIEWCVHNEIPVLNMSISGRDGNETVRETVVAAHRAGVTIVVAAGNTRGGPVGYPAVYEEVLAISASTSEDRFAKFSARGPEIDFIAPGANILSTAMGGGTMAADGTSAAAPHVAGLVALKLSRGGPWTPQGVRRALEGAAETLPGVSRNAQGAGLVNAAKLVGEQGVTPDPQSARSVLLDGASILGVDLEGTIPSPSQ